MAKKTTTGFWFFKLFGVPLQIGVGLTHLVVRQVAQGGTFCGGCA